MNYLLVLAWPVGIAVIFVIGLLLTRRSPHKAVITTDTAAAPTRAQTAEDEALPGTFFELDWVDNAARLLGLIVIGPLIVYGVMALLGLLVVHHGLAIDRPIYNWTINHRVQGWAAVQKRLTKIGDSWTCWGAAGAAAVCLAVTWREKRWLPPIALGAVIVVDKFTTSALRHTFHRLGPPDSPLGTYPSGGCDRVILFYGLIAYLLWREFSGRRTMAIWAGAAVAALGFNEAYSRGYLTLHWFTDILSGLFYGVLMLAAFITAVRLVAGPAVAGAADSRSAVAGSRWWRPPTVTTGTPGSQP
jgi:membrane-associated phospholipid phosphatase